MNSYMMVSMSLLTMLIIRLLRDDRSGSLIAIVLWIAFTVGYLVRALDDADKKKG